LKNDPAWEGLNTVWFALIAILWIGYLFLEGFDFGVGTLLPFISRSDDDRRVVIRSIGPFWDGNEVWLLTAGGATFAAFPQWYATLFSGFYIPLLLILSSRHDTGVVPSFVPFAALGAIVGAGILLRARHMGSAFALAGLTIALTFLTIFLNLYPHVLVSSTNRAFSLNVLNTASSSYTLTVMTVVAFIFTPLVLLYQGWTYWVFRQRVSSDDFALPGILQKEPGATSSNGH
jgi:cytochrome bd-type quinol oxidase subunit 2